MIDLDDCWIFAGTLNDRGYGLIHYEDARGGHTTGAHRVMYEAMVGEIPEGLTIDHLCFIKACINPKHLEAVTLRENILRSSCMGAINSRKTHCPRGHEYTQDNIYWHGKDKAYRQCKACWVAKMNVPGAKERQRATAAKWYAENGEKHRLNERNKYHKRKELSKLKELMGVAE